MIQVFGSKREKVTSGKSCIMICSLHVVREKIKEDEMSQACCTHGTNEKCIQNFSWKI
jgi:hypothetical protein